MTMKRFLFNLYVGAGTISLTAFGAALIFSDDFTVPVGIIFGSVLGLAPFISWHLIVHVTEELKRKDRIPLAIGIGLGKYVVLAGLGYLLFSKNWVHPWALLGGLTAVLPVLVIVGMRPPELKGVKKDADGEAPSGTQVGS